MDAPEDDPTRIGGRYRLEERIGAGAMGAVWRGTDELLNRPVALKELLAAASRGNGAEGAEEARQRLMREGRIGARLQHPHVISMFDVVIHDDSPWLVMEYLPSDSLAAVLSTKGPMDPRAAAEMGSKVADGLAAAHVAGVVHRDVKPGNVLIGEDSRVKLTDFGVSRAVDDVQLTRTGLIAGTPAFLAPEIARGHEPTAASDVFALGSTLYTAVEGHPPFGLDENAYALLHKVATGEIEPPLQAGPLTPVLLRLLAKDPDDRPTAAQARDQLALVAVGTGDDGPTEAPTVATTGRRPSIRGAVGRGGAGRGAARAGAAAGAGAGAGALFDDGPGTTAQPPAGGGGGASGGGGGAGGAGPDGGGRRRGLVLAVALVLLLLVGGGIALALLNSGGEDPPPVAQAPTSAPATTEAAPTTEAPPATTTEAPPTTTTTTPPTTTESAPAAPSTDPVSFVQSYYGLLPGNTDAAWAQLSPRAQELSGGRANFESFYGDLQSVTLSDTRQVGDGTVQSNVLFISNDGTRDPAVYQFVVADGIMQSFRRL